MMNLRPYIAHQKYIKLVTLGLNDQKLLDLLQRPTGDLDQEKLDALCGVLSEDKSKYDIDINAEDLISIFNPSENFSIGVGTSQGDGAQKALEEAMKFTLIEEVAIHDAQNILVHFKTGPSVNIYPLSHAVETLYALIDETAQVIFGTSTDETISNDSIKVTLIASK